MISNSLKVGPASLGCALVAAAALVGGCQREPAKQAKDEQLPEVEHWIAPGATERNTFIKASLTTRYFVADRPISEIAGFYEKMAGATPGSPVSFEAKGGGASGRITLGDRAPTGSTSLFIRREGEMAFCAVASNAGGAKNAGILLFGKEVGAVAAGSNPDLASLRLPGLEEVSGGAAGTLSAWHYTTSAPIEEVWNSYRAHLGVKSTNSWPTDHDTMMAAYRSKSLTNWMALPLQDNPKVVEKALLQPYEQPAKLIFLSRTPDEAKTHVLITTVE